MLFFALLAISQASIARSDESGQLEAEQEVAVLTEIDAILHANPTEDNQKSYFGMGKDWVYSLGNAVKENVFALPKIKECKGLVHDFVASPISSISSLLGDRMNIRFLLSQTRNPFMWISNTRNVMDIPLDVEDLEEVDMNPTDNSACTEDGCVLDANVLVQNLIDLPPPLVAQIWMRRFREAKILPQKFVSWLKGVVHDAGIVRRSAAVPGLTAFIDEIVKHVPEANVLIGQNAWASKGMSADASGASTAPAKEDTLAEVSKVFTEKDADGAETGETLVVASATSMWEDKYWRARLLEAIWPHADHIGGYMIRTAIGTVGSAPGEETVRGQSLDVNKKLMKNNAAFNAYSDKPVVAWEELDGELMDKLWSQAAPLYRELGVEPDTEYIVAFTLRGMKAGGLLDRSGKGLPGPIWHEDVFADYVVINYPFCFLKGYNNEVADIYNYEKADPGSKHLAKFTDEVENTVTVLTVPEGASEGLGQMVGFRNKQSRHRARPPMDATREAINAARMNAKAWGVPDNAVRAMIHMTIRKKSWTDVAETMAYRIPDWVGSWIGPLVKCAQQIPFIEQMWFNNYGGFIDRTNRTATLK